MLSKTQLISHLMNYSFARTLLRTIISTDWPCVGYLLMYNILRALDKQWSAFFVSWFTRLDFFMM